MTYLTVKCNNYSLKKDISHYTHTYRYNHHLFGTMMKLYVLIVLLGLLHITYPQALTQITPSQQNIGYYIAHTEKSVTYAVFFMELIVTLIGIYNIYININKSNFTPLLILYIILYGTLIIVKILLGWNPHNHMHNRQKYIGMYIADAIVTMLVLYHCKRYNITKESKKQNKKKKHTRKHSHRKRKY